MRETSPRRALTDWTTVAGLDGTGLLALVTDGADAEAIHLATLGYEVFVLHGASPDAERPAHVHHVVADVGDLPTEWRRRFGLVVTLGATPPVDVVADHGLLVSLSEAPIEDPHDFTRVARESTGHEPSTRTVWVRMPTGS